VHGSIIAFEVVYTHCGGTTATIPIMFLGIYDASAHCRQAVLDKQPKSETVLRSSPAASVALNAYQLAPVQSRQNPAEHQFHFKLCKRHADATPSATTALKEHLDSHVKFPATGKVIKESCKEEMPDEFAKQQRAYMDSKSKDDTLYKNPKEVLSAMNLK
jgi:hypothetical protein